MAPATTIAATALTSEAFAPYGNVIEARGTPDKLINGGRCGRFHDLATLDFAATGRVGISVFRSEPITLPHRLDLVERHPLGSQCFIPQQSISTERTPEPIAGPNYLVVVAHDDNGTPSDFKAFLAHPNQGVNYFRNTWHGVLMPINNQALFTVVDWIGSDSNLDEFRLQDPILITAAKTN